MSINDIRDQHRLVADRAKMCHYHAEAMKTHCDEVERAKHLARELTRCLADANRLVTMTVEYEAIRKN